jgi:hypothetical protein
MVDGDALTNDGDPLDTTELSDSRALTGPRESDESPERLRS